MRPTNNQRTSLTNNELSPYLSRTRSARRPCTILRDPSLVGGSLHLRTGSNRMGAKTRPHQCSGQRSATRETFANVKQGRYDVCSRAARTRRKGSVPTTVPKSVSVLPRRRWPGRIKPVARVTVEKAYAKAHFEQSLLMRLHHNGSTCGRKAESLGYQLWAVVVFQTVAG